MIRTVMTCDFCNKELREGQVGSIDLVPGECGAQDKTADKIHLDCCDNCHNKAWGWLTTQVFKWNPSK